MSTNSSRKQTNISSRKKKPAHTAQQHSVDVIIVGGGMVGLLFANSLINSNISIAIVESSAQPAAWEPQQWQQRVSAITLASQHMLENLGVWQTILAMRVSPFYQMQVWDAAGDGVIHFDAAEVGQQCLGHIVENNVIQTALQQQIAQQQSEHSDTVTWFRPATPQHLTINSDDVRLTLDNGDELVAKLIVGADGAHSWVREQAAISVSTTHYNQTAIVATVTTERPHQYTAWQRFLPSGPLAFLPLSNGDSSIVWSTTPQQAATLLKYDDKTFKQELAQAFDYQLGDIVHTSARHAFPLSAQHAQHYIKHRLALLGDAAHTIHPLAGQGVNLGFADAASLAEVIGDALLAGKDIGRHDVLRRYERWRKTDNLVMLNAMTGFKTLFGASHPLVTSLRNLGLNITNQLSPVKNVIIRHAMGLSGDLPRLARSRLSNSHVI